MPYLRPCVDCKWLSPSSASSRCSPSCASSNQTWERPPPRRSARRWRRLGGAEGRERGFRSRCRTACCRGGRAACCRRRRRAFARGAEPRLRRLRQAAVGDGRRAGEAPGVRAASASSESCRRGTGAAPTAPGALALGSCTWCITSRRRRGSEREGREDGGAAQQRYRDAAETMARIAAQSGDKWEELIA
eukprot:scaffold133347_cov92-Phaeocystis_antarctica.AAC.1